MSALGDTVGNFRSLGAAVARLVADLLDGPEPCGHDYDMPVPEPVPADTEIAPVGDPEATAVEGHPAATAEAADAPLSMSAGTADRKTDTVWLPAELDTPTGIAALLRHHSVRVEFEERVAEESSRAEGTQRAQTPGEVSGANSPDPSPSPGDLHEIADSELLAGAAAAVDLAARRAPTVVEKTALLNLADTLRDRAAQFEAVEAEPFVAHEDLAAHITAARLDWAPTEPTTLTLDDALASALLGDFYITKK